MTTITTITIIQYYYYSSPIAAMRFPSDQAIPPGRGDRADMLTAFCPGIKQLDQRTNYTIT